jgi:flagellar hook-basal body complex protein FliE
MDGLTIGNTHSILNTGQTSKEINKVTGPDFSPDVGSIGIPNSGQEPSQSFAASLQNAVNSVNTAQKDSDHQMQELATGKSQNIHETMIASEKADIALRLMVQVRNKMIEAYQEMMRMQV